MKILILIPLFILAGLTAVRADQPLNLTVDQKQQLQQLSPLLDGQATLQTESGKPLLVTFFASWCPPCTAEFRELNKLQAELGPDRIDILAINLFEGFFPDPGGKRLKRFLNRTEPQFAMVSAPAKEELTKLFGPVERIPTVYIFDSKGQEIYRFIHEEGATKRNSSYEEMLAALSKPAG